MVQLRPWIGLAALFATSEVFAQTSSVTPLAFLGAMPQCALPCMESGIHSASCPLTDISLLADCVCLNFTMQTEFNACIQTSCTSLNDRGTGLYVEGLLCEAYPKPNRSNVPVIASIVGILIAVPVVAARLAVRIKFTKRLWPDDYLSIITLVVFLALAGILIVSARLGLGLHIWNIDLDNAVPLMQIFFTSQIMYIVVQYSARVAILLLYQQVFDTGHSGWFGLLLKICLVIQVVKDSTFLFLIIFECIPISSVWDKSIINPKCLDLSAISLAGAIASIVTDTVLMLLPVPILWTLQISRAKRIGIIFIFAIASLGTIASIVRLTYLIQLSSSFDDTWDNVDVTVWSLIEILCMIVCGSIPVLRPFLVRAIPSISLSISWQKTKGSKETAKSSEYSAGRSASRYSTTNSRDAKDVSYSLSPLSSSRPKEQWQELESTPSVPEYDVTRHQSHFAQDVEAAVLPRTDQPRRGSASGSEKDLIYK